MTPYFHFQELIPHTKRGMALWSTLRDQHVVCYPGMQDRRGRVVANETALISKLDCFSHMEVYHNLWGQCGTVRVHTKWNGTVTFGLQRDNFVDNIVDGCRERIPANLELGRSGRRRAKMTPRTRVVTPGIKGARSHHHAKGRLSWSEQSLRWIAKGTREVEDATETKAAVWTSIIYSFYISF